MDSDFPLADDELKAIGKVTVGFNHLENVVRLLIMYLSGFLDDGALIMTASLDFRRLLDVCSNLGHRKFKDNPEARAKLDELVKDMQRAEEERNLYAHSAWIHPGSGGSFGFKVPRGRKDPFLPITKDLDINELHRVDKMISGLVLRAGLLVAELAEAAEKGKE